MVYKHAIVATLRIYAQHGEDVAKRGGLNSHGNYIADHGKIMELCFLISVGTLVHRVLVNGLVKLA